MTACNLQFAKLILDKVEFSKFKLYYQVYGEQDSERAFKLSCRYEQGINETNSDNLNNRLLTTCNELMDYALLIEKLERTTFTQAINATMHSSLPVAESCYDPFQNRNDPNI